MVVQHIHPVEPVRIKRNYETGKPGDPLHFESPLLATGKIRNVGLSGDFLVRIDLTPGDLEAWMKSYIQHDPDGAKSFLRTMLNDAEGRWSAESAMDPAVWSPG